MEEKDKMLDELFVLEDEAKDQSKKENKEVQPSVKEEDLKSINKEASDLAKEFDKKNKENLNKLKSCTCTDNSRTKAKYICIIVKSCIFCAEII